MGTTVYIKGIPHSDAGVNTILTGTLEIEFTNISVSVTFARNYTNPKGKNKYICDTE